MRRLFSALAILTVGFCGCLAGQTRRSLDSIPKPLKITHLRGVVVDDRNGVIAKVTVMVQRSKGGTFENIAATETNREGRFEFDVSSGTYQVVFTGPRGFCEAIVPVEVSEVGWNAFKLDLGIGASDTPPGYCQAKCTVEESAR